jgi:hypothetical protein
VAAHNRENENPGRARLGADTVNNITQTVALILAGAWGGLHLCLSRANRTSVGPVNLVSVELTGKSRPPRRPDRYPLCS